MNVKFVSYFDSRADIYGVSVKYTWYKK